MLSSEVVGRRTDPVRLSWTAKDTMLYALGVGAGVDDLAFTTESSIGVELQALPTFAALAGGGIQPETVHGLLGEVPLERIVNGWLTIDLPEPLPAAGAVMVTTEVAAAYDKVKSAVVIFESTAVDAEDGRPRYTLTNAIVLRGEGGWGGDRGPASDDGPTATRPPDPVVEDVTA